MLRVKVARLGEFVYGFQRIGGFGVVDRDPHSGADPVVARGLEARRSDGDRQGPIEFPRVCVLTIQGGGAIAIDLVGQLQGVTGAQVLGGDPTGDHGLLPAAIAGTSAGAIISALYWVGYNPSEIRHAITETFADGRVDDFFGPRSSLTPITFGDFQRFFELTRRRFRGDTPTPSNTNMLCRIGAWCRRKIGAVGEWIVWIFWSWKNARWILRARGIFQSNGFVTKIDSLIRRGPKIQRELDSLPSDRLVTFRDIAATRVTLPPLFLVTTDVATSNVLLVNSIEERFYDVSVAEAIRASASFPGFFQPWRLNDDFTCCIDGGVISNFPAWVFTEGFRRKLIATGDSFLRELAYTPWIHVGLRLAAPEAAPDVTQPWPFFRTLFNLLTGRGRARLDDLLSHRASKRIAIEQSLQDDGGPTSVLDFGALRNPEAVRAAFDRGRRDAQKQLNPDCFKLPDPGAIQPLLQELAAKAQAALAQHLIPSSPVRVNIFLPQIGPSGPELVIVYAVNMGGDVDQHLRISTVNQGVAGLCFKTRQPILCNLKDRNLDPLPANTDDPFFEGAPRHAPIQIRSDRTWLLSFPILDVLESRPRVVGVAGNRLEIDGPIFGVLCIDAAVDYDKGNAIDRRPVRQWEDPYIRLVFDAAMRAAEQCSLALNGHWLKDEKK